MKITAAKIYLCLFVFSCAVSTAYRSSAALLGVPRETSDSPASEGGADTFADYTVGVFLLESGSPHAAIDHLESAWEKSAHDETIGYKLAEAYFSIGDFSSCDTVLDELLSKDENNFDALFLKAKAAYLRARKEEALQYLEKLESVADPSFEVQRILARIYSELGRGEQAIEAFGKAIRLDSSYPTIYYQYGVLLQEHGRLEEAEEAFRNAVALRSDFREAAIQLAALLVGDGRHAEAELVLVQLLEADPGDYEALKIITDIYVDTGQLDEAIRVLEAQDRRSALPRDGVLLLGRLYYEVDDFDNALVIFERLFEAEQAGSELARVLGEISSRAGRTEDASAYYRRAIEMDSRDYRNHLALFFASSSTFTPDDSLRIELPDEERAQLLTDAAAAIPPGDLDGLYLMGISYQSIDSLESAREYLGRAAIIDPGDERVLLNLAGVFEKLERYEEAEEHLATLHEIQPEDPTTCNFYGYLLALMGKDLDKAQKLVEIALKHEPDNGYFIDSLGWVYFMKGNFDSAVEELERASKLVADDPVILEHLGDAYTAVERYRDALDAYERSIRLDDENTLLPEKISATRRYLRE